MSASVSVIIPTYNRAKLLPSSIESVLEQTYPHIEIIVVNDGSSDNTDEVIKPYLDRVIYIKRENGGCAVAKNTGVQAVSGDYITIIDDDDSMLPQRIERLVEKFNENPRYGLCATSSYLIDENGNVIHIHYMEPIPAENRLLYMLLGKVFTTSNMMVKREAQEKVGLYKDTVLEDYEMWLRIAKHYEIGIIEEPLVRYRKHENQITKRHKECLQAGQRITLDFLKETPLEEIVGRKVAPTEAYIILGIIMHRRNLNKLAYKYLQKAMPSHLACFWLGIIYLYNRNYQLARQYFTKVHHAEELDYPIEDALELIERVKRLSAEKTAENNTDPDVVQLRKDLSGLYNRVLDYTICNGDKVPHM